MIRVGNSRVVLDVVVEAYRDGATPEAIVEMYPVLRLEDVHGALDYYLRHREQVDEYIARREREADEARKQTEAARPSLGSVLARLHRRPT